MSCTAAGHEMRCLAGVVLLGACLLPVTGGQHHDAPGQPHIVRRGARPHAHRGAGGAAAGGFGGSVPGGFRAWGLWRFCLGAWSSAVADHVRGCCEAASLFRHLSTAPGLHSPLPSPSQAFTLDKAPTDDAQAALLTILACLPPAYSSARSLDPARLPDRPQSTSLDVAALDEEARLAAAAVKWAHKWVLGRRIALQTSVTRSELVP